MESPAVFVFAGVYAVGDHRFEPVPLVLLGLWMLHYVHRALVYPLRLSTAGRRMPVSIVAMGFSFNLVNAWLNARWISHLGPYADGAGAGLWLWVGGAVFLAGLVMNRAADRTLLRLRRGGDSGYSVPCGGVFRWVSCPNYLGEIIEWAGWALASRSPAALAFAVFTAANLIPRAIAHHRWYRANFPEYPAARRAVVPYLL
jgi:protein-S-isoprenylcysteine O-methyltransferase Ste14